MKIFFLFFYIRENEQFLLNVKQFSEKNIEIKVEVIVGFILLDLIYFYLFVFVEWIYEFVFWLVVGVFVIFYCEIM